MKTTTFIRTVNNEVQEFRIAGTGTRFRITIQECKEGAWETFGEIMTDNLEVRHDNGAWCCGRTTLTCDQVEVKEKRRHG
jgi:hypothetical protein